MRATQPIASARPVSCGPARFRRSSRSIVAVLACLLGVACGRDPRPDVLLIVLDAVRADHLSLYGYERPTTPGLEAFARDAVVYRNAVSADTWTPPSHASLLTGLLPSEHGVRYANDRQGEGIHALDATIPTIAERMQAAGYRTAAFLGNDGYLDPLFGLSRGFEDYRRNNLQRVAALAPTLADWLRRRRGRSVFVLVNVMDAHQPYEPPPPFDTLFPGRLDRPVPRHIVGGVSDPAERAHYVSQYDGALRYIDDRLALVFDALRQTGRYDNALVIVTADHGELFGDDGRWGHGGDPIFPLVHVPLVVKYPGNTPRGVEERPVSLVDVAPTILAVLGLPALAPGQVTLAARRGPVVSEHLAVGGLARLVLEPDGVQHAERTALPPLPRQGPIVFPDADQRLAERLRALGYLH